MNRIHVILFLLTMPFWIGIILLLWSMNPFYIVVPCGGLLLGGTILAGMLLYAAEIRTFDDWDLVIRSVLHRLGFAVAPPASLREHHHDEDHTNLINVNGRKDRS